MEKPLVKLCTIQCASFPSFSLSPFSLLPLSWRHKRREEGEEKVAEKETEEAEEEERAWLEAIINAISPSFGPL